MNAFGTKAPKKAKIVARLMWIYCSKVLRSYAQSSKSLIYPCSVFVNHFSPIQGAAEKITSLRSRHERLSGSIARYEQRIAKQMIQLEKMNRSKHGPGYADYDEENDDADVIEKNGETTQAYVVTEEDLKREDGDIRELEKKKRTLEERVSGMERDLGGLLR